MLPHKDSGSIYIVTSGLVKVTYSDPQSNVQEFFLATGKVSAGIRRILGSLPCMTNIRCASLMIMVPCSGGMVGLYQALTGVQLPGKVEAVAEGNALGKGPIIFELYQSGISLIRKRAAGNASQGERPSG